jgi:hypothetical protein
MKKIVTSICMVALVALAFTSCKKKETSQVFAFNGTTEQLVNDEGSFEKVYLDDNYKVQFEENDIIELFNITNATGTTSAAGMYYLNSNLQFVPSSAQTYLNPTTSGNYYAFYPGDNVVALNLYNENRATFRLDATQYCRLDDATGKPMIPNHALYMAAKDEQHQNLFETFYNFKNICGVLSCKFYSPSGKKVKSIAVTDKKFRLVGDVTLKIHEVDPVEMTYLFRNYSDNPDYLQQLNEYKSRVGYAISGTTGNTVVLDCSQVAGGSVQLGQTKEEATRFFIVLRPLALLNGCDIVITFDNNDTYEIHSTRDNRISPNIIRNISAVNVD